MKIMKDIITRISRWLLAAIGVAAVSGCDGDGGFLPAPEYGVPYASFEVKCTMVDSETGAPVKGVRMAAGIFDPYIDEHGNAIEYIKAEGIESEGGRYTFNGYTDIGELNELQIKLTDPDPEKDGHYKDSVYVVPIQKLKDPEKDDNWYIGTYGADVTLEAEQVK